MPVKEMKQLKLKGEDSGAQDFDKQILGLRYPEKMSYS